MENYWNDYKLLNSKKNNPNFEENSPLYTYELLCILISKGKPHKDVEDALGEYIRNRRISKGLYHQLPVLKGNGHKDDYMSHDQLTAYCCYSYSQGLTWHEDIWKELKRQWFHYDNINTPKHFWQKIFNKRVVHPRELIFIGYLAGSSICKMLLPLLCVMMEMSCKKVWKVRPTLWNRVKYFFKNGKFCPKNKMPHTDGKLLTYVRCESVKDERMSKIYEKCTEAINKNEAIGSWKNAFKIYFRQDPNHPNIKNYEE